MSVITKVFNIMICHTDTLKSFQSRLKILNVLLLSQFFSTTRGGGEYVFSTIARKLAENDNKVWVITNKIKDENTDDVKNITLVTVSPTLLYQGGLPPGFSDNLRYSFNAVKSGLEIIKKENIDIIHSNNFAPSLAGSILAALTSKPHITTVHDIFTLCGKDYWKRWGEQGNVSKINVTLAPFFEKLSIKLKHDCIHTVSNTTRDDLIKFGEKKPIHVIENSIIEPKTHNSKQNLIQFIYVGRLVFYKNLEVIIRATSIARKQEPKIKLVIVGDGPHRKSLEELVKKEDLENNVKFRGYVTEDEKIQLISESNAMLFPSLCEGFGLVILEAFSQNRPVLVSNLRPMSEIITHKETGFVLDPYDEKAWAEHILQLIKEPQKSQIMGKNGNTVLKTKYTQEVFYENLVKMYNSVLSK